MELTKYKCEVCPYKEKQKWIPVSERLPEDRKPKLVYLSTDRITVMLYNEHRLPYSNEPIGWGNTRNFHVEHSTETVIAWMPLPEPYKEEGDQDG